jgi:flavodoxin I
MIKTGIFYGSTTGNTENAANLICALIGCSHVMPVDKATKADFEACELLVLGTSTWGMGDLQDDWYDSLDSLRAANLQGKKVALFGLGDQSSYPYTFVDGIKVLYDTALAAGATVVGRWPIVGYAHQASAALEDGQFVGLPLDQENQAELTEERIQIWVDQILREMS